ncbi:1533_t:CDS:1 [Diversispora eburnea]|uniref:1533_t:CDS:1 n=1 Tax=Diversispora eburnea TaxID=1213867 RepID=A0A9N9GEH7_9GLOM|nr:1533_t:CDS:1 [Diversispora eburnea]
MEQWSNGEGESRRHAFDSGQLILKANQANPNSRGTDGSTRGIFIIGDQSSSKSTTVNSIIKQVALQMGSSTVTKIRTWIEHRYDPELEDPKYDLKIEHHNSGGVTELVKDGTLQDLTNKFTKLNEKHMDDVKDARIVIHSNIPSFAIDCCDNPGLTPVNAEIQKTTDGITRRTLEKVLERQKLQNDSIVVLCISALVFENPSWPRHMDLIKKINGNNLIVLVTRMDQLNIQGIAQEMRGDQGINNNDRLRCSPMDILRFIRGKIEQQAKPHEFPEGVQFHYAASSSKKWDDLMVEGWSEFEKSERKNNSEMIKILCEVKNKWLDYGIELTDLKQKEEFMESVGMPKLQERLLQRLHVDILKATEELMDLMSKHQVQEKKELEKVSKNIKHSKCQSELIPEFCKHFISLFQTLFASPLYSPPLHSNPRLIEFYNGIKRARETIKGYGWTLKDMWEIFENLKSTDGYAEFPPKEFRGEDFQKYVNNVEKYINSADKYFNTAQMLVTRLTQECTLRSTLIELRELDVDEFVARQVQASTSTQLNFGQAIDQQISEDYSRIFHSQERKNADQISGNYVDVNGGNQWVAIFGALCLLLHAEYTLRIMRDTPYSSLLQTQSVDPMQGLLVTRFERYWKHRSKNSQDLQTTENQIARIMIKMKRTSSKKPSPTKKVPPIEDILWALYTMFFDRPYNNFKQTLDGRTDLLMMTHANSLVHFYQLSSICVHQDREYLKQWGSNNTDLEYVKTFLVKEEDVQDLPKVSEKNDKNKKNEKGIMELVTENLQKLRKKEKTNYELGEKRRIFTNYSEEAVERVRSIIMGKPLVPEEKVKIFVDFADMGKNPDAFDQPESKTNFGDKEKASVNYIYKRRLTMGITNCVIDAIQQLAKMQYEFNHQQNAPELQRELLGRVASLMLGYGYPYHPDTRPPSKWYLSPKVIVQFLRENEDFLSMPHSPEEQDTHDYKARLDPRMLESPIIKRIFSLGNDDHKYKEISNHINQLEKAKRDEVDAYIIEFLAEDRFDWQQDQDNLQRKWNDCRNEINNYRKWHYYLGAYKKVAETVLLDKGNDVPEIGFSWEGVANEFNESIEFDEFTDEDDEHDDTSSTTSEKDSLDTSTFEDNSSRPFYRNSSDS